MLPDFFGRPLGNDEDLSGLDAADLIRPFLPSTSVPPESVLVWGSLSLRIATAHVLTLNDPSRNRGPPVAGGLAKRIARPALLMQSLLEAGVHVAAVQESRCEQGTVRTGEFLRFCSGPLNGQYGCELWFKLGFRVFQADDLACEFHESRFSLLYADPRRILIRFCQGRLSLVFASLHAPHRATEAHLISAWWAETTQICHEYAKDSALIIAGDLNA